METLRSLIGHVSSQSLIVGESVVAAIGIIIALFIGVALYIVNKLVRPKKNENLISFKPFVLDLPAEEVAFAPRPGDHMVQGIYLARQDATTTILVSPGYRKTFLEVLGISKHLWMAGHNVLAFEYHGHGMHGGIPLTLGYREVNDFLGAVSYARQRAPQARIGALGYSMGGAVTIMGSAQTPEVLAIIADSAFASQWSAVEMEVRRTLRLPHRAFPVAMNVLRWVTDLFLAWRAGYHFRQVEPWRDIARIAPRPVLLIHGMNDKIVHPDDSVQLYEAAGSPKTLWHIPDTGHVKGYFTDNENYTAKVISFFDWYLKQSNLMVPKSTQHQKQAPSLSGGQQVKQKRPGSPTPGNQAASSSLGLAYGHLVYRLRKIIIAVWIILLLASLPLAGTIQNVLHNSGYSVSGSESQTVNDLLISRLHQPATQILAVFQSSTTFVGDQTYQRELNDFMKRAQSFAHVTSVTQAGVGTDGRSDLVVIGFNQDKDAVAQYLPDFRKLLPAASSDPAQVSLTGDSVVANEVQLDTQSDTETSEIIALPLTLLALILVFGTLVAGLMPIMLAAVAVPCSLAMISLIALHVETNIFIQSLASIIGLGLSIDYSLFMLRRFREELDQGCAVPIAMARTIATAGEAILFSAITVAIGFGGLLFINIQIMISFGIGGIVVASVAALAALTLLPAVLCVVGQRINALPVPILNRWSRQKRQGSSLTSTHQAPGFWQSWARFVMKRPLLILTLTVIALIGLSWPALGLNPGLPGASSLPSNSQVRRGLDTLTAQFPKVIVDPIDIVVQTRDGSSILASQNVQRIASLTRWIAAQSHVTAVTSLTSLPAEQGTLSQEQLAQLYQSGAYRGIPLLRQFVDSVVANDTTLITVRADTVAGSPDDEALINRLRAVNPQIQQGLTTRAGGARAINLDFDRVLYGDFGHVLIFILLATYLLLLLTFRSIVLPLKAIIMNGLSIGGAYGALVFVFQQGHFEGLLRFTASTFIDRFIPILLFCVLFGLSMDYEVFLLSRMREEWLHTGNNQSAVARGLEKTGGVITSAALLFMIVSGSFIFAQLVVVKELGLGITVAVLVDATLIRSLLVPATMQLMGSLNWWFPSRRAAVHRRGDALLGHQKAIEQKLIQIMAYALALSPEQLPRTAHFFDYGGNSESLTALLSAIYQQWHVPIEADDIFDHPVVLHLATVIALRQRQQQQRAEESKGYV